MWVWKYMAHVHTFLYFVSSRELRALVVEMVLATDMSCHFQQVKTMKNFLQQPEGSVDLSFTTVSTPRPLSQQSASSLTFPSTTVLYSPPAVFNPIISALRVHRDIHNTTSIHVLIRWTGKISVQVLFTPNKKIEMEWGSLRPNSTEHLALYRTSITQGIRDTNYPVFVPLCLRPAAELWCSHTDLAWWNVFAHNSEKQFVNGDRFIAGRFAGCD